MDNTERVPSCSTSSRPEHQSIWRSLALARDAERAAADEAHGEYRSTITTPDLIVEVRRLLATERRAERLVCRYLADMADRLWERTDSELSYYDDEYHAARCYFGLSERETRERIRVGRALRQLPRVERAFISGDVSYSRVREVSRVAQPDTEASWLHLARTLDMRTLERRVAAGRQSAARPFDDAACADGQRPGAQGHDAENDNAKSDDARDDDPSSHAGPATLDAERVRPAEGSAVRVTFELSAEAWHLLQRALDATRASAATALTDSEALEALARNALESAPTSGETPVEPAAPAPCEPGATGLSVAPASSQSRRPLDGAARVTPIDRAPSTARKGPCANDAQADDAPVDDTRAREQARYLQQSPEVRELLRRPSTPQSGHLTEHLDHLIDVVGQRERWTTEDLIEASGLTAQQVMSTLILLELGRYIQRDGSVFYST